MLKGLLSCISRSIHTVSLTLLSSRAPESSGDKGKTASILHQVAESFSLTHTMFLEDEYAFLRLFGLFKQEENTQML